MKRFHQPISYLITIISIVFIQISKAKQTTYYENKTSSFQEVDFDVNGQTKKVTFKLSGDLFIKNGETKQYKLEAIYDGKTHDFTNAVTWESVRDEVTSYSGRLTLGRPTLESLGNGKYKSTLIRFSSVKARGIFIYESEKIRLSLCKYVFAYDQRTAKNIDYPQFFVSSHPIIELDANQTVIFKSIFGKLNAVSKVATFQDVTTSTIWPQNNPYLKYMSHGKYSIGNISKDTYTELYPMYVKNPHASRKRMRITLKNTPPTEKAIELPSLPSISTQETQTKELSTPYINNHFATIKFHETPSTIKVEESLSLRLLLTYRHYKYGVRNHCCVESDAHFFIEDEEGNYVKNNSYAKIEGNTITVINNSGTSHNLKIIALIKRDPSQGATLTAHHTLKIDTETQPFDDDEKEIDLDRSYITSPSSHTKLEKGKIYLFEWTKGTAKKWKLKIGTKKGKGNIKKYKRLRSSHQRKGVKVKIRRNYTIIYATLLSYINGSWYKHTTIYNHEKEEENIPIQEEPPQEVKQEPCEEENLAERIGQQHYGYFPPLTNHIPNYKPVIAYAGKTPFDVRQVKKVEFRGSTQVNEQSRSSYYYIIAIFNNGQQLDITTADNVRLYAMGASWGFLLDDKCKCNEGLEFISNSVKKDETNYFFIQYSGVLKNYLYYKTDSYKNVIIKNTTSNFDQAFHNETQEIIRKTDPHKDYRYGYVTCDKPQKPHEILDYGGGSVDGVPNLTRGGGIPVIVNDDKDDNKTESYQEIIIEIPKFVGENSQIPFIVKAKLTNGSYKNITNAPNLSVSIDSFWATYNKEKLITKNVHHDEKITITIYFKGIRKNKKVWIKNNYFTDKNLVTKKTGLGGVGNCDNIPGYDDGLLEINGVVTTHLAHQDKDTGDYYNPLHNRKRECTWYIIERLKELAFGYDDGDGKIIAGQQKYKTALKNLKSHIENNSRKNAKDWVLNQSNWKWFDSASDEDGLPDNLRRAGLLVVWTDPNNPNGTGHVGYVEAVSKDKKYYWVSEFNLCSNDKNLTFRKLPFVGDDKLFNDFPYFIDPSDPTGWLKNNSVSDTIDEKYICKEIDNQTKETWSNVDSRNSLYELNPILAFDSPLLLPHEKLLLITSKSNYYNLSKSEKDRLTFIKDQDTEENKAKMAAVCLKNFILDGLAKGGWEEATGILKSIGFILSNNPFETMQTIIGEFSNMVTEFTNGDLRLEDLELAGFVYTAEAIRNWNTSTYQEKCKYVGRSLVEIAPTVATGGTAGVALKGTRGINRVKFGINKAVVEGGKIAKSLKLWNKIEVNGKHVYQRNDLFQATPNNIKRMKNGNAPIGIDGESVNLHHIGQLDDSPLVELTATVHRENKNLLHVNPSSIPSGIDRNKFDTWRANYWKRRANDF